MSEHEPRDLDVLWEIVRYLRVRQEQTTGHHGETFEITALLKELTQIIASLSNSQTIHIQEAMMNDYYQVGQAGAVGRNSVAIRPDFTQVWSNQAGEIDLNQLAQELHKVRDTARASSIGTPDQDVALGELANAEVAARQGDGSKALSHLAHAGQWALRIANEIGVPVAIKAIEMAIGS
jgi:hypothetical protein